MIDKQMTKRNVFLVSKLNLIYNIKDAGVKRMFEPDIYRSISDNL